MRKPLFLSFILLVLGCLALGVVDNAFAITGCTAVTSINTNTTSLEPAIMALECPTPPCNPGLCTYNPSGTGAGTFSSQCGPVTKCVIQGEDPPIGNGLWDEPKLGFQGIGGSLISGVCAPPKAADNFLLKCPVPSNFR